MDWEKYLEEQWAKYSPGWWTFGDNGEPGTGPWLCEAEARIRCSQNADQGWWFWTGTWEPAAVAA